MFNAPGDATAYFLASQFDNTHILTSLKITGDSHSNFIVVSMAAPGTFSAAAWSFVTWTLADSLSINGSTGVDTITGGDGAGGNPIVGGNGADTLTGGMGPDNFRYFAATEIEAGESLAGGGGFDVIQLNCDGSSYDFSGATISGVEDVSMNLGGATGSATVTFAGSQLRAGGISEVFDSTYTDTVIVIGASVDLSGVTFQNWTNGTDTIKIIGTTGADALIGSDQKDIITGDLGKDTMTGGGGADLFDFNLSAESRRGATRDVILDFHHGEHDRIDLAGIDAKRGTAIRPSISSAPHTLIIDPASCIT